MTLYNTNECATAINRRHETNTKTEQANENLTFVKILKVSWNDSDVLASEILQYLKKIMKINLQEFQHYELNRYCIMPLKHIAIASPPYFNFDCESIEKFFISDICSGPGCACGKTYKLTLFL